MRVLLLLGLLGAAAPGWGQSPDSTHTVTVNAAISLPPLFSLSVLPVRLSADDSLRQLAYRRNRVKTVTLVQLRGKNPADTVDYTEVDRQGNILLYRPAFGQTYRQRYNRRHELVERTTYPAEGAAPISQVTYEPATGTTTTRFGPSLAQLATWQTARTGHAGDTLVVESFFQAGPLFPASPMRRLVLRTFRTRGDTVRSDAAVYDANEQLMQFESYYRIGSRQRPLESGLVSFETPAAAAPAQTPASARQQLAASHRTHGRYLPTARYRYDAQGGLVRQLMLPPPHPAKPVMTLSADERTQLTIAAVTDTSSVRYVRTAQGQLLREEYHSPPRQPADEAPLEDLSFTEYTYLPNGLRQTKAGSLAARYEYHYTYY